MSTKHFGQNFENQDFPEIFQKKINIWEIVNIFHFFRWIFNGFSKNLMLWKEEKLLVHSNPVSIYEIFL